MFTVEVSFDTELFKSVELWLVDGLEMMDHFMVTPWNQLHAHC